MPPHAGPPTPDREARGTVPAKQRTPTLEVRHALLRAARQLLDEGGPSALAIRDIAARAGVAPMGVYNRFGSKDGILNALLEEGFEELAAAVAVVPDSDHPLRSIAAGMANYRAFALANPAMYRLMFDPPISDFQPSDTVRSAGRTAFNRLVDAVRLGIATSRIRPGEPDEIAQRLWAACHGAISLELRNVGFVSHHNTHYAALVHTLLRGIATNIDAEAWPETDDPTYPR